MTRTELGVLGRIGMANLVIDVVKSGIFPMVVAGSVLNETDRNQFVATGV